MNPCTCFLHMEIIDMYIQYFVYLTIIGHNGSFWGVIVSNATDFQPNLDEFCMYTTFSALLILFNLDEIHVNISARKAEIGAYIWADIRREEQ